MKEICALGASGKFFLTAALFFVAVLAAAFFAPSPVLGEASVSASTSTKGSSRSTVPAPSQREDVFMGTGNSSTGGFSSTFKDPQSGDIITRVIPPAEPNQLQTPVPIYIYPQVEPQWPPKNNAQPNPVFQPRTAPQSQTLPQAGSVPQARTVQKQGTLPQKGTLPPSGILPQQGTLPPSGILPQQGTLPQSGTALKPPVVPGPYSPKAPSNPSLFQPNGS